MRFLLTVQYLGTRYAGWQAQANAVGVQQVLEAALTRLAGQAVRVDGASRTDAGVHAQGQRAQTDLDIRITARGLLLGLNDVLPQDIRIRAVEEVLDRFHCRFDAIEKTYEYRIWNSSVADVFHFETHAVVKHLLDEGRMHGAAQALAGHHDFRAYTVADPSVSSTWRTISSIGVWRDGQAVTIRVTADGFLRYMVRRIAGSLIEAGLGRVQPGSVAAALEPDFEVARWTAAAKGLTLMSIRYRAGAGIGPGMDDTPFTGLAAGDDPGDSHR